MNKLINAACDQITQFLFPNDFCIIDKSSQGEITRALAPEKQENPALLNVLNSRIYSYLILKSFGSNKLLLVEYILCFFIQH